MSHISIVIPDDTNFKKLTLNECELAIIVITLENCWLTLFPGGFRTFWNCFQNHFERENWPYFFALTTNTVVTGLITGFTR